MLGFWWLPLALTALLGLTGSRLGRALPPATAVWMLTVAALVSALATGFVLAVAGFLVLAQVPLVALLGGWSIAVLRSGQPVPIAAGTLAGLTVVALLAATARHAALAGRELLSAAVVCRRLGPAASGLVVVEEETPDAYALPGLGGLVIVSTAMLRALHADERQVLLAHEAAHLSCRHHFYVQIAELAAAANPLLRPVAHAVRAAVERHADEVAAAEVGDRQLAARALARAGLARAAATRRARPLQAAALAGADGQLVERARALLTAPPAPRPAVAAVVVSSMLATLLASGFTAHQTEHRFERAQLAYHSSGR